MAIIRTGALMEKKSVAVHLLFIWCGIQLLTPFAVPCALECSRTNAPLVTPAPSHACCVKDSKSTDELKSFPLCVCSIQSNGAARLEAENVLSPLKEKDKVRAVEEASATTTNHNTLQSQYYCPLGLPAFPDTVFSSFHSVLRI